MVDSFGSLPHETKKDSSSPKLSLAGGDSARKPSGKTGKTKKSGKSDNSPPVRRKLVDRVRAEIAAGTFETPDRIEATIDCILDEILEK